MSKIYEKLRLLEPKYTGTFGIEIECEGNNLTPIDSQYWRTEDDGSLRGRFPESRCEYVLKKPLKYKSAMLAVGHLLNQQRADVEFNFSFRTSVHIHVNVSDMEWEEYLAFCYTWLLCEGPLMDFCGESRKANRFCLRSRDSEGVVDIILKLINDATFVNIQENDVRYAALNVGATAKYGSLEFRGMRGTTDVDVLSKWMLTLGNMREYCLGKSIQDVHKDIWEIGNKAFLEKVTGSPDFWNKNADSEMDYSFSMTIQLPYAKEFA